MESSISVPLKAGRGVRRYHDAQAAQEGLTQTKAEHYRSHARVKGPRRGIFRRKITQPRQREV